MVLRGRHCRRRGLQCPAQQRVAGATWLCKRQMPRLSVTRLDVLVRVSPGDSFCLPTWSGESVRLREMKVANGGYGRVI